MQSKILYTIIVCLISCTHIVAQHTYSLKKCLEIGLGNNYGLKISQNEEDIARNNASYANAGLLPSIEASGGVSASLSNSSTRARESGTTTSLRNAFNQWAGIGVNVSYTLFDGFNNTANYNRLRELAGLSATSTRMQLEDFTAEVASEYYNLLQQELRLKNYLFAVELSRERVRIVYARYTIGSSARLDYLQAKVDLNADSAQYITQLQKVEDARIRLNQLLAVKDMNQKISTADTIIKPSDMLDLQTLRTSMLAVNTQLLAADSRIRIAEQEYRQVKSRDYPYVRLNAGYDFAYNHYGAGTNTRSINHGPEIGATVGINIWDGKRSIQRKNAQLNIENTMLAREDIKLTLDANLSSMWNTYVNNHRLLTLERNNMTVACENYNIAKERYMLGDLPGIDLREAQKGLLDARERILVAAYNLKVSEISLSLISGTIMNYY